MSVRLRFGLFELDSGTGALSREGMPVKLQPQPARVLGVLAERAGEVVSRDELRELIWPEGTFVDFERGLNF
jgi:DNA-binding winged helix-turn-helix (wHTH) protein